MDKETKKLLKEREKLTGKLCREIVNLDKGKTKIKLK